MSFHGQGGVEQFPTGAVTAVSCNDAYSFSKPNRAAIELVPGQGVRGDIHAGVTVRHRSRVAADPTQPNLRQVHLIQAELHDEVRGAGYEVPAGGLGENVTTSGVDLLSLPCGTILRFGPPPSPPAVTSSDPAPSDVSPTSGGAGSGPATSVSDGGAASRGIGSGGPGASGGAAGDGLSADRTAEANAAGQAAFGGGPGDVVAAAGRASLDGATAEAVAMLGAVIDAEAARGDAADPRPAVVVTGLRNPCQQINRFRPGLLKQVLGRDADGQLIRRAGVMAVVLHGGTIRPGDPVTVEPPAVVPHRALERV